MQLGAIKEKIRNLLIRSQRYTKTDMIYLASGGFWLTAGKVATSLSSLISSIAFANLMRAEVFGVYQYILSVIGLLTLATLPQMNMALIRSVAQGYEGNLGLAMREKMKWGVLGTLGSIGIGIYYLVAENTMLGTAFLVAAPFIPFIETLTTFTDFLQGKKMFDKVTKYRVVNRLIILIAVIGALLFTGNIFAILLAYLLSRTLGSLFLFVRFKINEKTGEEKDLEGIRYGRQLSFVYLVQTVIASLDKILIFHFLGPVQLSTYYFAIAPEGQLKNLFLTADTLAFVKFSKKDNEELKKSLPKKILQAVVLVVLPAVLLYILLAPALFKMIFPRYIEAIPYSQVYMLSILFTIPKTLFSSAIESQMKKGVLYPLKIIGSALRIIALFIGLYFFGLWGIIIGLPITYLIVAILHYAGFKRG